MDLVRVPGAISGAISEKATSAIADGSVTADAVKSIESRQWVWQKLKLRTPGDTFSRE
jgi:hypothetical protein